MTDQREQHVEGHQVNIENMRGVIEQVGDRYYNEIIVQLDSFENVPPEILHVLQTALSGGEDLRQEIETARWEPQTVLVPAGPFTMGSEPGPEVRAEETPAFQWQLSAYRIGRTPVTNEQYAYFVRETERRVSPALRWSEGGRPGSEQARQPVAGVSWYDALAYCLWLARETDRPYTLPNEAQWEKAARGGDGNPFPWGNDWEDGQRCNDDSETITAVEAYPEGQSPYGCLDMVGNVREWTVSLWGEKRQQPEARFAYPWQQPDTARSDLKANSQLRRVTRGGAPLPRARGVVLRATRRGSELPLRYGLTHSRVGFRVALNLEA